MYTKTRLRQDVEGWTYTFVEVQSSNRRLDCLVSLTEMLLKIQAEDVRDSLDEVRTNSNIDACIM